MLLLLLLHLTARQTRTAACGPHTRYSACRRTEQRLGVSKSTRVGRCTYTLEELM